jgi:DNA topoisomerase-1
MAPGDLTVDIACELLAKKALGPETIGVDPVTGRNLLVRNRNGFYLETERTPEEVEKKVKPRWISLPPGVDPTQLSPEILDQICRLPKEIGKHPEMKSAILLKIGKFGSYLECGAETRSVDWEQGLKMSVEEAVTVLAQPKGAAARRAAGPIKEFGPLEGAAGPVKVLAGRFGPYVTDGATNATLPKDMTPEDITPEQAVELLKARAAAGPPVKRRFARKAAKPTTKRTAVKRKK